jgi:hypothetical protein
MRRGFEAERKIGNRLESLSQQRFFHTQNLGQIVIKNKH